MSLLIAPDGRSRRRRLTPAQAGAPSPTPTPTPTPSPTPAPWAGYPLLLPSTVRPASFVLRACDIVASSTSPFTGTQQVYRHQGQYWEAEVGFPPLNRTQAYALMAVLDRLKGTYGTLAMGDPVHRRPLGTGGGSPRVNGTHPARSETLSTRGWTPGQRVLKAGDLFQLGYGPTTRLHRNLNDADADASGQVTLEIWPATRYQLADGDYITIDSPMGQWRMMSAHRDYAIQIGQMYSISLSLREAL